MRASSALRQITGARSLCARFPGALRRATEFVRTTPRILDGKFTKAIPVLQFLSTPRKIAGARSLRPFSRALRQVTGFLLRHPTHPRRQIGQGNSCVCGLHPHSGRLPGCVPPPIFQSIATSDGISPAPPYASSTAKFTKAIPVFAGLVHAPEDCGARSLYPLSRSIAASDGAIPDCPMPPRRQTGCCTTPHRSRLFGAVPRAGPVQ